MFKEAKFKMGYVDEVHTQVLELPYVEEELSMIILLPDDDTDLAVVSSRQWVFECLWSPAELISLRPSTSWHLRSFQLGLLHVVLGEHHCLSFGDYVHAFLLSVYIYEWTRFDEPKKREF